MREADDAASPRERLLAAESCLAELEQLRHRQELVVRAALRRGDEKLQQENVQLLKNELRCLRRRDAGLVSQLHELDRQISELLLDSEVSRDQMEIPHAQQEADSRASSGFYELSDAASASLSNSSNSIFSECFCWMADPDGFRPSNDKGGDCSMSDSALPGSAFDSRPSQFKHHSNVLVPKVSEVSRPSGPATVAAPDKRSRASLQVVTKSKESATPGTSPPVVQQSCSWPADSPSKRHLDNYIYRLLQRRAPLTRAGCPKTIAAGCRDGTQRHPLPITQSVLHTDGVNMSQGRGKAPGPIIKTDATNEQTPEPAALTKSQFPNLDKAGQRQQSQLSHRKHNVAKSRHFHKGRVKSRLWGLEDTDAAPLTACKRPKRPPPISTPDFHHRRNHQHHPITKSKRGHHRSSREDPSRDAFRCQRKSAQPGGRMTGSDSEYSAKCSSSRSTSDFAGDRRSSKDEAAPKETEGAGPGVRVAAQTFVKIKASRHLKKKILCFRSGSLQLMTTV